MLQYRRFTGIQVDKLFQPKVNYDYIVTNSIILCYLAQDVVPMVHTLTIVEPIRPMLQKVSKTLIHICIHIYMYMIYIYNSHVYTCHRDSYMIFWCRCMLLTWFLPSHTGGTSYCPKSGRESHLLWTILYWW